MKYKYIHIFSFVAALLMLATFSACEADDKIVFVTGTDIDKEESEYVSLIDVTDNSDADWNTLPAKYVVSATHTKGCSMDGLKSVKVYCDPKYLNVLVEVNLEVVTDHGWTSFHIYLNADGSAETGGYGDEFADADAEYMLETAVYQSGAVAYNPAVFKWWGEVGGSGWLWTDPENPGTAENGWGAVVPEGSSPAVGYAQQVNGDLSKIEIQIVKERVPAQWANEFTIGFDIQQNWTDVGVLPNAADDPITGARVRANKLKVKVNTSESSTDTPKENIPVVVTSAITQITETSAVAGGTVTSDGAASVIERGVVYSTNSNPVITNLSNTIRPCGSGTGEFTYNITDLQPNTTYYLRAYAKNDVGTAYGEEVTFTTNKLIFETMYLMPPQPSTLDQGKQMMFDGSQFVLYGLGYPKTYECLLAVVGTKFGRIDWNYPVLGTLNGKIALITEEQLTSGEASTILLSNNEIESIDTVQFNPLTFDLYYGGKRIQYISQLDVNADLSEIAGKNYRYAKIFFDPALEVTISGVTNISTAYNLDYMEVVDGNVVKFLGEKGMYEVYYLPEEDYIVVEPLRDAVYPNVMWMTGEGFGLPVAEPKTQGGWGFDNLGQYIACRTVAPKVYQFTAYLKNGVNADFETYGSLNFKFFHQKGWGGEEVGGNYQQIGLPIHGVTSEGLTKVNGDTGVEAGNWIAATQDEFEGIYRITLDQNNKTTTYEKIR